MAAVGFGQASTQYSAVSNTHFRHCNIDGFAAVDFAQDLVYKILHHSSSEDNSLRDCPHYTVAVAAVAAVDCNIAVAGYKPDAAAAVGVAVQTEEAGICYFFPS